nr:uncharacterized protein LOC119168441 [Rhipicephalus microplus]
MYREHDKFYTPNTTIWTLLTTRRKITCKVDYVNNATNTSVFFKREYCLGHEWVNTTLQGIFITISLFTNATYDAMRVSPPGIMSLVAEQILFADPTFTCGVFKIFLPPSVGDRRKGGNYELRMRGSYNTIYDSMCYAEFKKYALKDFVHAFLPVALVE